LYGGTASSVPHVVALVLPTMTPNSTSDSSSIFKDGKLKPGTYKIRNIQSETYLDIEVHSREVCCRPTKDLEEGRGFWEIKSFGGGYVAQVVKVEPGEPDQFCTLPTEGLTDYSLTVTPYPVAWRVELVNDDKHRGFEYVRFYWGLTNWTWNLENGSKTSGTKVALAKNSEPLPKRIWKLIPAKAEGAFAPSRSSSETLGSVVPPSYNEDAPGNPSTYAQHTESERDEFGTVVNEVTVVTSTVTTRKRYRVEDA